MFTILRRTFHRVSGRQGQFQLEELSVATHAERHAHSRAVLPTQWHPSTARQRFARLTSEHDAASHSRTRTRNGQDQQ